MNGKSRPLIAVSACLLGENVRYNGGHCKNSWIVNELSDFVDILPICPEVEMNLGTPREEIHLVYNHQNKKEVKLISKYTREDLTGKAEKTYQYMSAQMEPLKVDGFILTRKSPSCGLGNVKTVQDKDPSKVIKTAGLFAKHLQDNFPSVPKIDSGRIKNFELRELFMRKVFAHFRFNNLAPKTKEIQDFHMKYKYLLMEHSTKNLKTLGQIASNTMNRPEHEIYLEYYDLFFQTLEINPTISKRINSLQHVMGYFKKQLDSTEKQEILKIFEEYRDGITTYMTPHRFFEFLTRKYDQSYLKEQYLFSPYPKEMKILRDAI